jgi:Tol biopolymer transport system component/DNA-binding winged helix-turn-helix (wHTH) protein
VTQKLVAKVADGPGAVGAEDTEFRGAVDGDVVGWPQAAISPVARMMVRSFTVFSCLRPVVEFGYDAVSQGNSLLFKNARTRSQSCNGCQVEDSRSVVEFAFDRPTVRRPVDRSRDENPENVEMSPEKSDGHYTFDDFRLDIALRKLWRNDERLVLPSRAFEALRILVEAQGKVVDKETLVRTIWPDSFVGDDSLAQTISSLRKALGDNPSEPRYIRTVARLGYRFVGNCVWTPTAKPEAAGTVSSPVVPTVPQPVLVSRAESRFGFRALLVTVVVAVAGFAAVIQVSRPRSQNHDLRILSVLPAAGMSVDSAPVVSPDGRQVAFVAKDQNGRRLLHVRDFGATEATALPGTDDANEPFWSPDGKQLGFFGHHELMRVLLAGGAPTKVTDAAGGEVLSGTTGAGGTWNRDDEILFAPSAFSGLYRVPAKGGVPVPVTKINPAAGERGHRWPYFLPDGHRFVHTVVGANHETTGIYLRSLDSSDVARLLPDRSRAIFAADHLLFRRNDALMAAAFDGRRGQVAGRPIKVANAIAVRTDEDQIAATAADDVLAYVSRADSTRFAWFDRAGNLLRSFESSTGLGNPALSPDENEVAGTRKDPDSGIAQMWRVDLRRDMVSRMVSGPQNINQLLWSSDGNEVVFSSGSDLYRRPAGGSGLGTLLLHTDEAKFAHAWSRDGRFLVFTTTTADGWDLWLLPLVGDRKPTPLVKTRFNEFHAQISPDGRWLAYASDETGAYEVYVQRFPTAEQHHRISSNGGSEPQWRGDGRELFYLSTDGKLMSVDLGNGEMFDSIEPRPLFQARVGSTIARNHYVAARDGSHFLINTLPEPTAPVPITVELNWTNLIQN